uniref:Uncharacterized protein n=1 Tax=Lepeophtheirus salmonis TaxID=72036 RepID=A0A0K2TVC3_LEPSM
MLYQTGISLKSSFILEHLVYFLYVHDLNCCYKIETNSIRHLINHLHIQGATNP